MLEGKEFVKQLGNDGEVSLDLTPELKLIVETKYHKEVDLIGALKAYAQKTETKADDKAVAAIEYIIAFATKKG